jgi:replicative DNA helicase
MEIRNEIENFEEIVLGILLRDPELIMSEPIELTMFSKHRRAIQAMVSLSGRGVVPDVISISDEMGDGQALNDLINIHRHTHGAKENYKKYLNALRARVQDVAIIGKLNIGLKKISDGDSASSVLGGILTESLSLLSSSEERKYAYSCREMLLSMTEKLEEILDAKDGKSGGLKTGLSKIDDALNGLHPSDLVIVGARPGVGKTALAISVMLNMAKAGLRIGFISTEMAVDQIAFRISSQTANVDAKKYRKAAFNDMEWSRVMAATQSLQKLSIRICDKPVMRVSDVMMQCRAWDMDGGVDFVIVDYLTRIKPDKESNNQNLAVGEIVTGMKNMARDFNIPVMVLAQLNRQVTTRANGKPKMSDLRDSGIIEQEADSILLLHRDDETQYSCILIDKNRHGESGIEAEVSFDGPTMRWFCEDMPEYL